jgi:L-threonylcarbamoyladenylate synthase
MLGLFFAMAMVGRVEANMNSPEQLGQLQRAIAILKVGGVVAFPTETVYGLGADARNPAAVRRVFAIKGRPVDHPLIVHIASIDWLGFWAREVSAAALDLAQAFWPGPLTLVLPRRHHVSDAVTGSQDSVALRMPAHPMALQLIAATGALVAPSANRFGRISPTTAGHVRGELGKAVNLVLDGGPCSVGVESTIVSLVGGVPRLLRPGGVALEQIEAVLGRPAERYSNGMRAPGLLRAHYAPATPLFIYAPADIAAVAEGLLRQGQRVAVMTLGKLCKSHRIILPCIET